MRDLLLTIFNELNEWIEAYNAAIGPDETGRLRPIEVLILGQFTLLANDVAARVLTLQRTNDLDAVIKENDWNIRRILDKEILRKHGLELEPQSDDIWIPPGAKYDLLQDFKNVRVKLLDPESALVSKAVKAKKKNKILIIDAVASGEFPTLVERIEKNGGDLEYFIGEDNGDE
jgi:hypothetical protein